MELSIQPLRTPTIYGFEIKPWSVHELDFWYKFGIPEDVLDEYNVYPLYWVQAIKEDVVYPAKESNERYPIFLIKINDHVKVYFPAEKPGKKWLSNTRSEDIFGLSQAIKAAEEGKLEELGLLAGQKDILSLYANTGIRSIALNSESSALNFNTYLKMSEISEWTFVLYDNDKTGILNSTKISKGYPIVPVYMNKFLKYSTLKYSSGINDVSDWYEYKRKNGLNKDRLLNLIHYEKSAYTDDGID